MYNAGIPLNFVKTKSEINRRIVASSDRPVSNSSSLLDKIGFLQIESFNLPSLLINHFFPFSINSFLLGNATPKYSPIRSIQLQHITFLRRFLRQFLLVYRCNLPLE